MLLIVTIGLVLVAVVLIIIGFISNSVAPFVGTIICAGLALIILLVFWFLRRRPRRPATAGAPPAPLVDTTPPVFSSSEAPSSRPAGPPRTFTGAGSGRRSYGGPPPGRGEQPTFGESTAVLDRPSRFPRVGDATPPPPEPTEPSPAPVAAASPAPAAAPESPPPTPERAPAPARGFRRPEPLAVPEPPATDAGPAGFASMGTRPAPVGAATSAVDEPDDELPFPIEDYDELRVVEILPLLAELDDQELQAVRDYERANRARLAIVSRIDAIISGEEPQPAPAAAAAARGAGPIEAASSPAAGELPIADYDELSVSEILPLLAELDDEELEQIRDYEEANQRRNTVLDRIDVLLGTPIETGVAPDEATVEVEEAEREPEAVEEAEEAESAPFPIADYDRLRVFQILTVLSDLNQSQLRRVRDYEAAGRSRMTILNQIDSRLAAPSEPELPAPEPEAQAAPVAAEPRPEPEGAAEPEPQAAAEAEPEPEAAPEPEPELLVEAAGDAEADLPIADYDELRPMEILTLLDELNDDELEQVRAYEDEHRGRAAILFRIDSLLREHTTEAEPEPDTDVAAEPEPVPEPERAEEPAAGLPIADYDRLRPMQILSQLDDLSDAELEQVRAHEEANRGRATILFRIEALLSAPPPPPAALEPAAEPELEPEYEPELEPQPVAGPSAGPAEADETGQLPIADYDELRPLEILSLLDELDDDELVRVRDYEDAHRGRVTILRRIADMLQPSDLPAAAVEAPPEPQPQPEPEPEPEPEPVAQGAPSQPAAAAAEERRLPPDIAELSIADYDELAINEILPLLAELDDDELGEVQRYEAAHLGRRAVLERIDALFEPFDADDEPAALDEDFEESEEWERQEQAPGPPPAAEEVGAEDSFEDDEFEEDERVAAGAEDDVFPIADYDDLRVAEILPLLSQLLPDELEMVARHEEQLANRTTILTRIDRLLSMSQPDQRS